MRTGVMLALAACGIPSASKRAEQERQRLVSAATTSGLIADAWAGGAVPGTYASNALRKIGNDVEQTGSSAVWQILPPEERQRLRADLTALARTIGKMDSAVVRGDRSALAALRRRVAEQRDRLAAAPIDTTP